VALASSTGAHLSSAAVARLLLHPFTAQEERLHQYSPEQDLADALSIGTSNDSHVISCCARIRAKCLAHRCLRYDTPRPMSEPTELDELVDYLVRSSRLTQPEAVRLIDEVIRFMSEAPEDFVRRRHLALQSQGLSNAEIFARLSHEVAQRRFRAPAYSERQLRRIVYG
jgi:hypothetical protein